jgi:hypothetical protein
MIDPSGRAVFAAEVGVGVAGEIEIGRLNIDGQPDRPFGSDGNVLMGSEPANFAPQPLGFAFQPDGGILVVAEESFPSIYRVDDHGMVDSSYFPPPLPIDYTQSLGTACGVAIDIAGRAVYAEFQTNGTVYVQRYTTTGAADPTFGGQLMLPGSNRCNYAGLWPGVVATPTGGFVIPSYRLDPVTQTETALLLAVDSTGEHETVYELPGALSYQVVVQPDGKILVDGETAPPYAATDAGTMPAHAFLARYLP